MNGDIENEIFYSRFSILTKIARGTKTDYVFGEDRSCTKVDGHFGFNRAGKETIRTNGSGLERGGEARMFRIIVVLMVATVTWPFMLIAWAGLRMIAWVVSPSVKRIDPAPMDPQGNELKHKPMTKHRWN